MTSSELVIKRYSDAYKVPKSMTKTGNLLVAAGAVLGSAVFISGVLAGKDEVAFLFALWVLAGFIALIGCALGRIVFAQGQILKASLDAAVNTSPFLSEADRIDVMSLTAQQPWSLLGIGSVSAAEPGERAATYEPPVEDRRFESPVAALISGTKRASCARSAARRRNNSKNTISSVVL